MAIHDDASLEHEADQMGARAARGEVASGGAPVAAASPGAAVAQAKYDPSKKQRLALEKQLKPWLKARGGDLKQLVDDFAEYCDDHQQALTILRKASYEQWEEAERKSTPAKTLVVELTGLLQDEGTGEKLKKQKDPLDDVRREVKSGRLDLKEFTDEDLQQILALKATLGWEGAIKQIYSAITEAKEGRLKKQQLIADYAQAKALGDLAFPSGLVGSVWALAYYTATSPRTNSNAELGNEYDDATILAAVAEWRNYNQFDCVTNIHVPGKETPIQDKSKRLVNPDKTRGRQADFVSVWNGQTINVHVNSTMHHD